MAEGRRVVVIHGWSDRAAGMQPLSEILKEALGEQVSLINLADYQSMDDEITFSDVRAAMNVAWNEKRLPTDPGSVDVVVHSTGGLVVRDWLVRNYEPDTVPIKHLLMLAPANFGSPLAHKGFSFIGRVVKGWDNVKPLQTGARLLKGLELGSPFTWNLAQLDCFGDKVYYDRDHILCTVLVGNSGYKGISAASNEDGSDGTVRVSTANLECAYLKLDFTEGKAPKVGTMKNGSLAQPSNGQVAFGILDGDNHATIVGKGKKNDAPNDRAKAVEWFRRALTVSKDEFDGWCGELADSNDRLSRRYVENDDVYRHGYQNLAILVRDDHGAHVRDYFLEFYVEDEPAGTTRSPKASTSR